MSSEKVEFTGAGGHRLAARLERPAGAHRAVALFAHCFACSKDTLAAARVSQALAEQGFLVLRFDFTGLGASEGDFANTHFSSNVDDLVAAADWLRAHHDAPRLLVGHSLGGAASIVAAARIPEVTAVATIGAPAAASHIEHQFAQALGEIEAAGEAEVRLGGRPFRVRREFLEDVRAAKVEAAARDLRRALLILHSPTDETVGIENATALYAAARHPKSFISLDHADHLLTRRDDARYAATVIAAWASRYAGAAAAADEESPAAPRPLAAPHGVRAEETGEGRFHTAITIGPRRYVADEPVAVGGTDAGPSPYEWVSAGLAACTSMTLRLYAERKGWPLERVRVDVDHAKISQDGGAKRDRFMRQIHLDGPLDQEQRQRLLEIAAKCPVHRTLEEPAIVETELSQQ